MSVKEVESFVSQFTRDELAEFRAWFEEFDAQMWDQEIEQDLVEGRLDFLIQEAEEDLAAGRTQEL
jgi:hypothetical protein